MITIINPILEENNMTPIQIAVGIILIALSLFLIVTILLQSSKTAGLSGTIGGGAETFFGKNKQRTLDAKLHKATIFVSAAYLIAILVLLAL